MRRRTAAVLLSVLAAGTAAACSSDEALDNAEVGECIESLDDLGLQVTELPDVPCTEPHDAEVFFLYQHADGDFPGDTALSEEATEVCQGDAFEDYVGTPYDESAIIASPLYPSEESWGAGDRESICIAFLGDEQVSQSFKDAGEDFLLSGS